MSQVKYRLPIDAEERKRAPVYSGVICYFPLALFEIAKLSLAQNRKHNPGNEGTPIWNRESSTDQLDALTRHLIDNALDPDGADLEYLAAMAWRALAELQLACERRYEREADSEDSVAEHNAIQAWRSVLHNGVTDL